MRAKNSDAALVVELLCRRACLPLYGAYGFAGAGELMTTGRAPDRRLRALARFWAVGTLISCLLLAACGTSVGQTSKVADPGTASRSEAERTGRPPAVVRSTASAPCFEGTAQIGKPAGAIDFRLRCNPRQADEVMSFFITRAPLKGQGKPGIRGFRRRPALSPANGQRFGRCAGFSGSGISCSLRSSQSTLVEGRIWVNAKTRCDYEVVLTVSPPQSCRSDCAADQRVLTIFAGRPHGC